MMVNHCLSVDSDNVVFNEEDNYAQRYFVHVVHDHSNNEQARLEFLVDVVEVCRM